MLLAKVRLVLFIFSAVVDAVRGLIASSCLLGVSASNLRDYFKDSDQGLHEVFSVNNRTAGQLCSDG
jgi:hypothetical protein